MVQILSTIFVGVHTVLAATTTNPGGQGITLQNPLSGCNDLSCPVNAVAQFLFTIAIPICAIFVLVGGFQMMTAAGDPEKFGKGRKTILYAVIGFAIVLLAGSVAALIKSLLGS